MFYFIPAHDGFPGNAEAENIKELEPPNGDQKRQEVPHLCPRLLRVPFICSTNTVVSWSQPTGLLSHRTKVTQTNQKLLLIPSLTSTAKVDKGLFEGTENKIRGKFQASGVCQGPTLHHPRWRGRHSGVSPPWAATGTWSVLLEALALGLPPRPPDPRPAGSPCSPTRASGFLQRPIPQTGSPGMEKGGISIPPVSLLSSCFLGNKDDYKQGHEGLMYALLL